MCKKLVSIMLTLALSITALAGCGGSTDNTEPATTKSQASSTEAVTEESEAEKTVSSEINFDEEPYEVNFLYWVAREGSNQDAVEAAVSDLALKELNMTVNLIPMTVSTYYSQLSMMLASGESIDILPTMIASVPSYLESQYLVNISDYLDYFDEAIDVIGEEDALSGYVGDFLVGFPCMKERAFPAGLVVRKDILDELGYTADDFNITVDDYSSFNQITTLFEKVKEAHPEMICLDGVSIMGMQTGSYVDNLGNNFGVVADYGQDLKITNWYESKQYNNFCELGRDWFQAGYTSADIAINKDTGETKMRAGNCFSFITNVKPSTAVEKEAQTGYEVVVIPLSESLKRTNGVNSVLLSIASSSKDPVKAAQFLNWSYTNAEFNDLLNWGIKGEDWVETDDGMAAYPEGVDSNNVGYHNDYGFMYPNQFIGHAWVGNPIDIWNQYNEYNNSALESKAFGFNFNPTGVATEIAQLSSILSQYEKDLAFGVVNIDTTLAEFNDALYAAGLQKVLDEKQTQLDAWLAEQK